MSAGEVVAAGGLPAEPFFLGGVRVTTLVFLLWSSLQSWSLLIEAPQPLLR